MHSVISIWKIKHNGLVLLISHMRTITKHIQLVIEPVSKCIWGSPYAFGDSYNPQMHTKIIACGFISDSASFVGWSKRCPRMHMGSPRMHLGRDQIKIAYSESPNAFGNCAHMVINIYPLKRDSKAQNKDQISIVTTCKSTYKGFAFSTHWEHNSAI
jgi:hypothetical protein